MRYIKKVDVTPTIDNGGKIIDSFGTNDNHAKNAPSLKAVEERTDNNLLFNGWFANGQNGVKGWSVNPYQGSAGQFGFSYKGLSLTTGFVGSLVSPSFCPISPLSDYENNGYSVTVKYRLSNSEEILTVVSEGIFDLSDNDITIVGNGNLLVKLVGPVQQSGRFVLQVTAYTNLFIIGVKLEKGGKASNFNPYGKDAGINELIGEFFDKIYPVGSVYTSVLNVNPGTMFGGTWVAFASGRSLVGVDPSQTEFNVVNKTGGSKLVPFTPSGTVGNHILTVNELPDHAHWDRSKPKSAIYGSGSESSLLMEASGSGDYYTSGIRVQSGTLGNGHNHPFVGTQSNINVLSPYVTVYFWRRVS